MESNDNGNWREILIAALLALLFAFIIWIVIMVDYLTLEEIAYWQKFGTTRRYIQL